jgi:hypothetical protein
VGADVARDDEGAGLGGLRCTRARPGAVTPPASANAATSFFHTLPEEIHVLRLLYFGAVRELSRTMVDQRKEPPKKFNDSQKLKLLFHSRNLTELNEF